MDNIEKLAEWLYNDAAKDVSEGNTATEMMIAESWDELCHNKLLIIKSYDNVRQFYRDKARSLLTFQRDELGMVQIQPGDIYWTKEQLSAPDSAAKYYPADELILPAQEGE